MSRINRKYYNSLFLHIMVQGINRENIFKNEFYKKRYLDLLMKNFENYNLKILAYTIMNNHAHILVYYNKIEDVSNFMHLINCKYARFYNKNEERVGYVFRNRYRCEQIKDEQHLFNVLPYIHYNPVKAKIVDKPEDYCFSSFSNYIQNDMHNENAYILFNTYDYIDIFKEMHRNYLELRLLKEEKQNDYKEVIENFKEYNKIKTTEIILKEKNLLLELVLELKEKTNLKDYEITKILGIGKNRIYLLMKLKNEEREYRH